jgi:excisionase family DNA binding protein
VEHVVTSSSHSAAVIDRLLSLEEVAVLLATSPRHVKRLVYERRIPYVKVGRWVRFDHASLVAWLEEHAVEPNPPVSRRRRKMSD